MATVRAWWSVDLLGTGVRVGLAAVWLVAGGVKLLDPGQTYLAVRAYQLLPDALVRPVAVGLPLLELLLGVFLLIGLGTRLAAVMSALLLIAFIAAVGQSWARGLTIGCGCFGGGGQVDAGQTSYPSEIARDVAFLCLAGWLVLRPRTRLTVNGRGSET